MAQIRLTNLHKSFGDFVAVRDSSLTIEDGSFFVLLGPSGCGKTTTLRMIAGLELPTSGEIRLDGEDVTFRRARERDIAFVFQLFALYPHMNVRRNIGFPLAAQGVPARRDPPPGRGDGQAPAHRPSAEPPGRRPRRRRPPARSAGPRHRPPSQGLPDGRAAGHARRRLPRADVRGAARPARPHRRHHGLRHPRPDRGHGDGRRDRGHEQGRGPAGRHAVRDLPSPAQHVRGPVHRQPVDELPALRARQPRGRLAVRPAGRRSGAARGRACRSWCWACGPSMSASPTTAPCAARCSASSTWAPARS